MLLNDSYFPILASVVIFTYTSMALSYEAERKEFDMQFCPLKKLLCCMAYTSLNF